MLHQLRLGNPLDERRVRRLKDDLAKAGVGIVYDREANASIGSSIGRFVKSIDQCDYVIVVGTPAYLTKYQNCDASDGSVVAAEMDVIFNRLLAREGDKKTVLPVLLDGDAQTSFPAPLRRRVHASLIREEDYFPGLIDLVLAIYQIPPEDPGVSEIRQTVATAHHSLAPSAPTGLFAGDT